MKTFLNQIGFLVIGLNVFMSSYSQEQPSVFIMKDTLVMKTEGVCFLVTGLNKDDAKTFAINDAKRNALEQAGTYLESYTTILNQKLVKDEIISLSTGLLKVEVLKEESILINNMVAYKVEVLATIDMKLLNKRKEEFINSSSSTQQLGAENERNKQLDARITELQTPGRIVSEQEVKTIIDELSSIDWFNKGIDSKDSNLQIEFYSRAIKLNPQFAKAYNNRGFAYANLGNHDIAIQDYNKAIELNPQLAAGYQNRGIAYANLGNYDTAIIDYNKAIELNPQYAKIYNSRGCSYANLGNHDTAMRDFNKAIKLNPMLASAYVNRGIIYNVLGKYDRAIRDFTKAIDLNSQNADAFYHRSIAYGKLHNTFSAYLDHNFYLNLKNKGKYSENAK